MDSFDFHTVIAMIEATLSFKHFKFAFCNTSSDRILSESLVLVMDRAVALIALLISSVIPMNDLSSIFNLIGIVTGHDAKILPMSRPLANVVNRCSGIE